jgi:hypothetical protein
MGASFRRAGSTQRSVRSRHTSSSGHASGEHGVVAERDERLAVDDAIGPRLLVILVEEDGVPDEGARAREEHAESRRADGDGAPRRQRRRPQAQRDLGAHAAHGARAERHVGEELLDEGADGREQLLAALVLQAPRDGPAHRRGLLLDAPQAEDDVVADLRHAARDEDVHADRVGDLGEARAVHAAAEGLLLRLEVEHRADLRHPDHARPGELPELDEQAVLDDAGHPRLDALALERSDAHAQRTRGARRSRRGIR